MREKATIKPGTKHIIFQMVTAGTIQKPFYELFLPHNLNGRDSMTSKAQRFIASAFNEYGDNNQKGIWQSWVDACPEIQSTSTSGQALRSMDPETAKEVHSVL